MTGYRASLYQTLTALIDRMSARVDRDTDINPMELSAALVVGRRIVGDLQVDDASMVLPPSPALEQWRRRVLEDSSADPLTRAAAWELTAIQCEQSGAHDLAEKSRANAVFAMRARRAA